MLGVGCRLKVSASFTCRRFRRLSPRSRSANSSCAQLIRSIFSSKNQQLTAESSRCVQSDAFELRALFCDAFGPNLSNELAHGLLDEEAFHSPFAIYAWWLGLHLVFHPWWNMAHKSATEGEAGPDD